MEDISNRSSEYLLLCSAEERNSSRFATTWGWINDGRIFIFGWSIPLSQRNSQAIIPSVCFYCHNTENEVASLQLWTIVKHCFLHEFDYTVRGPIPLNSLATQSTKWVAWEVKEIASLMNWGCLRESINTLQCKLNSRNRHSRGVVIVLVRMPNNFM